MRQFSVPPRGQTSFDRRFASKALHLAQSLYLSLGTERSLRCLGSSLKGDIKAIVSGSIDPLDYSDGESFRRDYLASELLSKADFFDLGIDRESVALQNFLSVERQCSATSKRLQARYVNGLYSPYTPESILQSARGKIARLLGPFSWDLAEPHFRFGPGATLSVPHRRGDAYFKWREKPSATYGSAILSYTALHRIPRWFEHVVSLTGHTQDEIIAMPLEQQCSTLFNLVPGNRVTFVPKDALKDRTIAIEPTMNGFLQHGIGSLLRRRLRRAQVGGGDLRRIDLDDQSRNQDLAYIASLDGSLATLDLSAASDSISWELVQQLFPADWVDAFRITRSPVGTLPDGSSISYSKVSSMGNGFTFELESILFWALARSVVDLLCLADRRVSVYGDDIIVPVDSVPTVTWMLEYWGFKLNARKSHATGWFRESCGKHFFRGLDVTPIYIRKDIDTVPRLFWFANQIRRWSRLTWGLDSDLHPTYELAVSFLPRVYRQPSIPDGIGDYGLIGDLDEVVPSRLPHGLDGWKVKMRVPLIQTREYSDTCFLLRQLGPRSCSITDYRDFTRAVVDPVARKRYKVVGNPSRVPDGTPRWVRITVPVTNWPSFGPWLHAIA